MTMEYHEGIKRAIAAQMAREGIKTHAEVAAKAGIRRQTLSRYLDQPGGALRTLARIADAVGSTPAKILAEAEKIIKDGIGDEADNQTGDRAPGKEDRG